jgi:hypothetical protein
VRARRACRPRQKVRRRQSSSLTRNSKRSPNRANRDSGLKSEPSTAFTTCFSAGSRRRSARQGSELINPGYNVLAGRGVHPKVRSPPAPETVWVVAVDIAALVIMLQPISRRGTI